MHSSTVSRLRWGLIALLLTSFWLRLHALLALPAFVDEANHLRWAAEIWQGRVVFPFSTAKGLTIYYFAAFLPFGTGALWIGRAAVVLSGVVTLSGLWSIGRAWRQPALGLLAAALYALMPWTFFHERTAVADPLVAAAAAVLAWTSISWARAGHAASRKRMTALAGLFIVLPLLKLSAVSLLALPPAVVALHPQRQRVSSHVRRGLLSAYVIAGIALALTLSLSALRYDISGELVSRTDLSAANWFERLQHNVQDIVDWMATYQSPIGITIVVGVFLSFRKRAASARLALGGMVLAGGIFVLTSSGAFPRYYVPALLFSAWLAADTIVQLSGLFSTAWLRGLLGLVLASWLLATFSAFARQAYRNPAQLKLPFEDERQYVTGWSAGYGIREATTLVVDSIERLDAPAIVYGQDLATWSIMRMYWAGDASGKPYELWDAQAPPVIDTVAAGQPAYLMVDRARDEANFEGLNINPHEIGRFPRPHESAPVVVYKLEAEPFEFPPP